ncbi:uncharacterized protein M6B38_122765 [Iris pallida]|uniref:HTH OST-type domain-containing protein n=1 Tax=Iris pallida TaxID=29817 RepID=A0AAX6H2F4_IRIPA|nr:uncharacterized protein M6B38_122765 [Iris pallida]
MRILTLISRNLTLTSPPSPVRLSFLLFHSSPCEESSLRRRPEPLPRRNYEEENRAVKVTVWWDFENCSVPVGINVERVAGRITAALRSTGIKGPVTITAFGDVAQMSRATQEALTSTGVCLNHVPHRGKNSSDRSFMADIVYWVTQNPPPAHFFLISGDKDFANILHRLRMSNYNILLSSNDCATPVLCSAATVMWPWVGLVKGENVNAKHFNHPPDGLYGSWYGHYKGVLDDPFVIGEQYSVPKAEESVESVSETKIHPVPKSIVNAIRNVLHSYPEGMYISELRAELKRKGVPMDREFYGYKKFSSLLSSLPTIVKFIPNPAGQGQPLVTDKRASELSYKCDKELETSNLDKVPTSISDGKSLTRDTKPSQITPMAAIIDTAPSHEVTHVDTSADLPKSQVHNAVVDEALLGRKGTTSEPPIPVQGHDAEVKGGLFQRIWSSLTGARGDYPLVKSDSVSLVDSTVTEDAVDSDNLKRLKSEEKDTELRRSSVDPASSSTSDLSAKKSDPEEKKSEQCDKHSGMTKTGTGFFSQLKNWWQFWKYGAKDQEDRYEDVSQEADANGKCVKNFPQNHCNPENHELFSHSHFWDSLESFLLTSKGSELISTSTTRDQLLQGLQKEGPCIVKDLTEGHFLRLVDLLISEKRWLEENASESFPFKLALPNKRTCAISKAHGSNGLSSLFRASTSHSNLQRLPEQGKQDQYPCSVSREANPPQNLMELKAWFQRTCNGKRNIQPEEFQKLFESKFNKKLICSSYGYPSVQTLLFACSAGNNIDQGKKKPPRREEVLSDCHKLLKDLLREHPQGINMSNFRPAFFQRYGYVLDCPMLGYPKLASLLQIMPGVKVESSFIMPVEMFDSEAFTNKTVDIEGKVMSLDSDGSGSGEEWEELGPVSDTVPSNNNKGRKVVEQVTFNKVSLSDEELTDSEDDIPYSSDKSSDPLRRGGENSSLLQLLDSWYNGKEGGDGKEQDEAADGLIDCSTGNTQISSDPAPVDSSKSKMRPHKSYNFVADPGQDENDKLVDSILGTFKKSGDSRLQS